MAKIFSAADIIRDSVNQNMQSLLDAWNKELEEAFKALKERAKELNETRGEEAATARRDAYQDAAANADAARLLHYVTGALNTAHSNDSVAIVIPAGVQVASTHLAGPSIGALVDAISELSDELAVAGEDQLPHHQKSAVWALAHGYAPHGNDLAGIIKSHDEDHPWSQRFAQLAKEQLSLPNQSAAPAQLRGHIAHKEIGLLKEYVNHLHAFGAKNLATLLTQSDSKSIASALKPKLPRRGESARQSSMKPAEFHRMLNGLFRSKKN
jgi:hypothetical protein